MTLGKIIQAARKQVGMTQVELGKKLGVSGSMIGQWENDLRNPKSETIGRIVDALGYPFLELFLSNADDFTVKTREKLEAIRAEDEAREKEISAAAEAKFTSQADSFIVSPIGRSIIKTFYDLNEYGQEEAMERIIELSFLPQFSNKDVPSEWEDYVDGYLADRYATKYKAKKPQETISVSVEHGDTTKKEKPTEGRKTPNDGKEDCLS